MPKVPLPAALDQKEIAARLFELLDGRSSTLAASTMAVDRSMYFDPETLRREREEIFANIPVMACHGTEVPAAYDCARVQLPNNEALVVRQDDGTVRAFVNTCRHRGARLLEEPTGRHRVITCRYHGWSYNADGALRGIPHDDTFGDVDGSCLGLVELPSEERHGFVWVVDRPGAEIDMAEWLGPADESLTSFGLDKYYCYRVAEFDEPVNWKTMVDGFFDAYHIQTTHAKSAAPYFYNNTQLWTEMGRHMRSITARKSIDKIRDEEPGAAPIDNHVTLSHWIIPNLSLIRQPDHFELVSMLPDPFDVNRCRTQLRLLVPQRPETDEETAHWERNWDILIAVLRDEDMVLNRDLQRATRNAHAADFVFGRNEIANQFFHNWYDRALADPRHWG